MKSTLNTKLLASMLKSKRGDKGLRETAEEIGSVSLATLSRVEKGNLPDVETFITLCKWLGVSTETFVESGSGVKETLTDKEKIVYQLRSSRELDSKTVDAMITMVDMAFTKRKNNAK